MAKGLDWNRARKPRETETKYENGTVLKNGDVVHRSLDRMAFKAAAVERQWLRSNRMASIYDKPVNAPKPPKKRKKAVVTKYNRKPEFSDAILDVLDSNSEMVDAQKN